MAIDSILEHIIEEAQQEKSRIIDSANAQAREMLEQAAFEAQQLFRDALENQKQAFAKELKRRQVDARLEARKELLRAKQELVSEAFRQLRNELAQEKIRKAQVGFEKTEEMNADVDIYLEGLRRENETEISRLLFGQIGV